MNDIPQLLIKRRQITEGGCWEWPGTVADGYGQMIYNGRTSRIHRVVWSILNGPIPRGMVIMHLCDNRRCWNPEHLKLGTQKENIHDALKKGRPHRGTLMLAKTHCPQGHAYSEHGRVDVSPNGRPRRACKLCQTASTRKRAGWPRHLWWIPSQQLGQKPAELIAWQASQANEVAK